MKWPAHMPPTRTRLIRSCTGCLRQKPIDEYGHEKGKPTDRCFPDQKGGCSQDDAEKILKATILNCTNATDGEVNKTCVKEVRKGTSSACDLCGEQSEDDSDDDDDDDDDDR